MRKGTPLLEWQIVEKHEEWEAALRSLAVDATPSASATYPRTYRRYIWGGLLALLLLLASAGGWLWHTAQAGLDQIEGELNDTVQIELASVTPVPTPLEVNGAIDAAAIAWKRQLAREQDTLHSLLPLDTPVNQLVTELDVINLMGDRAVAEFVTTTKDGTLAYRQTRFYQHTADDWLRIKPDAELWGTPRRLESEYFIYHFRQNDADVVAAVAPQIDALYTELQRNFGLSPSGEKLVIEVTVSTVTGAIVTPQLARGPLVVPSPALYLAPIELSDSALLAQSIALPLIDYIGGRARGDYAIPSPWWPLIYGLQLWQLWDVEMPLAQWRHDVVKWLYIDVAADDSERYSVLPDRHAELCAMHSLWMLSPLLMGIPLECLISDEGTWVAMQWLAYIPDTHLDRLSTPRTEDYHSHEVNYLFGSIEVTAVATLIEYVVAAYGHEQMPVLLAGLAHYDSWDTLIPAVYGVSAAEFEQGWQAYMATEYGVQP